MKLVLNLIITGIPSILQNIDTVVELMLKVLNLIITGIPSILNVIHVEIFIELCFKPYYNWNTFNTWYLLS